MALSPRLFKLGRFVYVKFKASCHRSTLVAGISNSAGIHVVCKANNGSPLHQGGHCPLLPDRQWKNQQSFLNLSCPLALGTTFFTRERILNRDFASASDSFPGRSRLADFHTSSSNRVVDDESQTNRKLGWWRSQRAELRDAPMPALILGFSGLIPFMVPAAYSLVTMSCGPNIAFAQVAYGATILSFLGGVRWGYALALDESSNWLNLGYSMTPPLIAWMGLMMPIQPGLFCIISGLAVAGAVDSRFRSYPPWFRSLRFLLTTLAVLSISVTFTFSILFPPPEPEHGYNFRKLIKIAQIIVQD